MLSIGLMKLLTAGICHFVYFFSSVTKNWNLKDRHSGRYTLNYLNCFLSMNSSHFLLTNPFYWAYEATNGRDLSFCLFFSSVTKNWNLKDRHSGIYTLNYLNCFLSMNSMLSAFILRSLP